MRRRLAVVTIILALGVAIVLGAGGRAGSQSTPEVAAVPGCTTAATSAQSLAGVPTSFVSGPISPFGIVISPNSKTAFVADTSGAAIDLYSLRSTGPVLERADTLAFGSPGHAVAPIGLALTPNGRYLLVTTSPASSNETLVLRVADLENRHATRSSWLAGTLARPRARAVEPLSVGGGALVAVSPNGAYAFVALESYNELAVFDLRRALSKGFGASDLVDTVPLGILPAGIAVSPNGSYAYVTSEENPLDANEGELTTISLAKAERGLAGAVISTVAAGCSPTRVVATKPSVFVAARGSDALLEFDAKDLIDRPQAALQDAIQVGAAPVGLALVDHGHVAVVSDSDRYASSGQLANLAVVTIAPSGQMSLDGYLPSHSFPRDMAASPDGKWLLVSNFGSGQVEAVKASALP